MQVVVRVRNVYQNGRPAGAKQVRKVSRKSPRPETHSCRARTPLRRHTSGRGRVRTRPVVGNGTPDRRSVDRPKKPRGHGSVFRVAVGSTGATLAGPATDHIAHLLAWAIERKVTATTQLGLPF